MEINTQLREPAQHSRLRKKLMEAYKKNGYSGIEKIYKKISFIVNIKMQMKRIIPEKIWNIAKSILK